MRGRYIETLGCPCYGPIGVEASEVDEQPWGRFVRFPDPDGNSWALQQMPVRD